MKYFVLILLLFSHYSLAKTNEIKQISGKIIPQMRSYIQQTLGVDIGKLTAEEVSFQQICDELEIKDNCYLVPAWYDGEHGRILINKDVIGSSSSMTGVQQKQILQYTIIHELSHHVVHLLLDKKDLSVSVKKDDKDTVLKKRILFEGHAEYLAENFFNSYRYPLDYVEDNKASGLYALPYSYGEQFFFNRYGTDVKASVDGLKKLLSDKVSIYEIIGKNENFSKTATSLINIDLLNANTNSDCKTNLNSPMTAADVFLFLEENLLNNHEKIVIYNNILSGFQVEIECEKNKINYYTLQFSDNISLSWDRLLLSGILAKTQVYKSSMVKGLVSLSDTDTVFLQDKIGIFYHPLAFYMTSKQFPEEIPLPLRYKTVVGFKHENLLFLAIGYGEAFNKPFCQPKIVEKHQELARICEALPKKANEDFFLKEEKAN